MHAHSVSLYNPGMHIYICRSQTGGSGQQCCYDDRGRLITGPPGGGTVDLVSPDVSFVRHFVDDVIPFLLCCKAGIFSNCDEYYERFSDFHGDEGQAATSRNVTNS